MRPRVLLAFLVTLLIWGFQDNFGVNSHPEIILVVGMRDKFSIHLVVVYGWLPLGGDGEDGTFGHIEGHLPGTCPLVKFVQIEL